MKKLLIITNLFWISVILFPAFIKPNQPNTTAVGSSYHLVDASLAKIMAEKYRDFYVNTFIKKKATILDNSNGVQNNIDSRSVWFSIKALKEYIHDMEKSSLTCDTSISVSGLRFYFIRYPERDTTNLKNPWVKYGYFKNTKMPTNYANRHSLMMVPTYHDNINEIEVDYDPRFCKKSMAQAMRDLIDGESKNEKYTRNPAGPDSTKSAIMMPDDSYTLSTAANRGTVSPPPYNFRVHGNNSVPCNGTTLMNFIDGYDKCGLQKISISSEKASKSQPKVAVPK